MKPQLIVIGLVLSVIVFYCIRSRLKAPGQRPNTNAIRPEPTAWPTQAAQNDKLIIVKGISHSELKQVLIGFCSLYNKESFLALPRLTSLAEREFAITFPYDVEFEIFCYLINYIKYPMELKWSPDLTAWTTIHRGEVSKIEKGADMMAMFFVPADDMEHDNVYLTTEDNVGYKLGFSLVEGNQPFDKPKRRFVQPDIELSQLTNMEFEDYK